ncbi:hypothetical protein CVT24_010330 [Panaeolus cyanescens]|uniref:Squalene monooxygenase n=1 Tax=Panaeolus cyanescens TaxID=181874 RepID=A0A409YQD6_9AGAR|nr:hypothetical protein CVT24_010330 [Panaeolus cyanescens]
MPSTNYDVIIVGAGVAGSSLAHGLSTLPRNGKKPLRIALVERSLAEPDRIVGELLQPGGVASLDKLGMKWCLTDIDAIPVHGYNVVEGSNSVHIPYPGRHQGRSFHHGKFIQRLREAASKSEGVDMIEATVTDLVEAEDSQRIVGVRIARKDPEEQKETLYADLVVVADGCFSNFRNFVMGPSAVKPDTKGFFFGAILKDVRLPIPQHGTVCLVKGFGPVLLYQIGEHDTRLLVDLKQPLPADIPKHILENVVPQLPSSLHLPIQLAYEKDRLRRMPNSFLPPVEQGSKRSRQGVILIGDAWNMRHPLTGGGMTVALNDVVLLRQLLGEVDDWSNWSAVKKALHRLHWDRKPLASTVNILSVALYDLFGADDEELRVLRTGCFKYFERGGECINGPVSMLSGIIASPVLLFYHFFSVAFYSIWVMFTHPDIVPPAPGAPENVKPVYARPSIFQYPALTLKAFRVFWTACVVFGPLLWTELRWWAPSDTAKRNQVALSALVPVLLVCAAVQYGVPSLGLLGLQL